MTSDPTEGRHEASPETAVGQIRPSPGDPDWVPVSPLLPTDPPRIGDFWLDARLGAADAGIAYVAHHAAQMAPEATQPAEAALVIVLSAGAAADAGARDRLAGVVNSMHIDAVLARGGHGQDFGRLARKYVDDTGDDPVAPDGRKPAPWVALAYDGSPAAAAVAAQILDQVQLATLRPLGTVAGPAYGHYWQGQVKPGLVRIWPLPWPGRYDRAGWVSILVSWLLMLLLAAIAVLIAILIFHNQPPQTPPTPTGGSGSPPPQSSSASPQSGSPSPQSGSPSPGQSGSPRPSGSQSGSGSPTPSDSGSGGPGGTPAPSGAPGGNSPTSRL